jgi:amino acid adenylation domain-containing protein
MKAFRTEDGIAVVGIGCRFPGGVDSPTSLWEFLCRGGDGVRDVPVDRWNIDAVHDPQPDVPGKSVTRRAALLDDVAGFDAPFFGISPREAAVMDPQQRLLLEVTWRALEDAGIPAEKLAGSRTGVYVGISHSDYCGIQLFLRRQIDVHTATGVALSIAANRLSHRLGLRGPSLAIDTACSSSLVALHVACTALLADECDIALVGGVNVMLTPDVSITFSRAGMLSPDGRCKAFDSLANGYVRGEGAGIVVLKKLARAAHDKDRIHAVIRSTAVNQDGHTSTITVPSRDAQIEMLREACARADIQPSEVGYVEAHGTGTPVGDPIEASAIGAVFGQGRSAAEACIIGSVKTNIGHLESAAGIAGLIKAVLCVRQGEIPRNLHFHSPNPNTDFCKLGIRVQCTHSQWPCNSHSRIAAVNSFGFGGTNACAIIEQPPQRAEPSTDYNSARPWPLLIPVSAATATALPIVCARLADALEKGRETLHDVAGTMATRRSHYDHRTVVLSKGVASSVRALRDLANGRSSSAAISGRRKEGRRLAFVFTGQGSQWWGMGRGLLRRDLLARAIIERCDQLFAKRAGFSLIEQMIQPEDRSRINETAIAQIAIFALQVALAERLAEWGIRPQAVVGHSIGEIAAAHVAGALSLPEAVDVVYHRSRLQERSRFQGGMAAIGLPVERAKTYLEKFDGKIEVAAINAPELLTVAGPRSLINEFIAHVARDRDDVLCQALRVDYAFHSNQMDPFTIELRDSLVDLRSRPLQVAMFSTVTGQAITGQLLDGEYWCRNMRQPVQFKQAIDRAIEANIDTFLELGPHPSLGAAVRACLAGPNKQGITLGTLHREQDDLHALASAAAALHVNGIQLDWNAIIAPNWKFIDLFGYPFEKKVHWSESEESRSARINGPVHPLLGYRQESCEPVWRFEIDAKNPRYLSDHRIDETVVFPAAGYVELMLAAARESLGSGPFELEAVTFHAALILGTETSVFLETSFEEARGAISIRSRERGQQDWTLRATGCVRAWSIPELPLSQWSPKVEPPPQVGRTRFYRDLAQQGHAFGPAFQGVETLWFADGCSLGKIAFPPSTIDSNGYILHPARLDSCFQMIRGFRDFAASARPGATIAIPSRIDCLRLFRSPMAGALFARAEAVSATPTEIIADISVFDDAGRLVATINGYRCVLIERVAEKQLVGAAAFYRERWAPLPELGSIDSPGPNGFWVILADRGGIGEPLAKHLAELGLQVALVYRARRTTRIDDDRFESTGRLASLRDTLGAIGRTPTHIVNLWPVDDHQVPSTTASANRARRALEGLLALARSLANLPKPPRVWIVTRAGVDPDGRQFSGASVLHSALTGFLRSLGNEYPGLRPTLVDFDTSDSSASALFDELVAGSDESEVVIRNGQRFGARLESLPEASLPPRRRRWSSIKRTAAFRASMSAPGLIDNLSLLACERPKPAPGEVLLEVRAVGLNFRDLMAVTGLLPDGAEDRPASQHLGLECAGIAVAVGDGIDPRLIGRRLVAMTPGCLASHIAVAADAVFPIPRGLSFAAAAAIPVAFATAHHALVTLGRLKPGERVLVHSAAGGVGLAAISVAKSCGAEILATAGNQEKRLYLHGLGVDHVFDSRSLDFADNVLWKTDGRGVDVVLNSLSGPFLEKSLSVLGPGGRFLEIGKRDIYANSPLNLHAMRNNGTFFAIDLAKFVAENPALIRMEVEAVLRDLARSRLQLLPTRTFPAAKVVDAFRHMSEGRHIGKLVVTIDDEALVEERSSGAAPIAADATYLITGGTGGLGLQAARWLSEAGARSLVLVGRSQTPPRATQIVLDELRAKGVTVSVVSADVGTRAGARLAIQAATKMALPLRGVLHAAGTIEDALIEKLSSEQIRHVFDGKVLGAWHLHELTQSAPLDFFVVFSSIAAALGSPGQAHYAAANRILDTVASIRRSGGLPGTSIAFGPVGDCGYLARRLNVRRYVESAGLQPLSTAAAMAGLATLLRKDAANVGFAQIDWGMLGQSFSSITSAPRTASLVQATGTGTDSMDGQIRGVILSSPEAQQHRIAADYLVDKVAAALKVEPVLIEPERPLHEIGLDSLTAFELKNRVEADLGIVLPVGKFLQKPTISVIASAILDHIRKDVRSENDIAKTGWAELEMSIGQQALWFINRLDPANPAYALVACVSFRPHLNNDYLDRIIQSIVSRHENLRVAFASDGIGPLPVLLPVDQYRVLRHDAVHLDDSDFSAILDAEANRPLDLETGPLGRLHLFRRADRDVLLLQFHHIVADAASVAILLDEVVEGYFSLQAGMELPRTKQHANFGQFVAWQQTLASGSAGEQHRSYWRQQLGGIPPSLPIATDYPRDSNMLGPGAAKSFAMSGVMVEELKALARSENTTLFSVLLTAFNILLHRHSGASDIVVGTPMSGRTRPEFERTIGYLVNAVPIRTQLSGDPSFQSLLAGVDATVRGALEHQDFPLAAIVQDLDPTREPGRFPIFQVMFGMERFDATDPRGLAATLLNAAGLAIRYREFTVESVAVARRRAPIDITFTIEEFGNQIFGVVDYRSDLWEEATITRMIEDYRAILHQIVASPLRKSSEFGLESAVCKPIRGPELAGLPDVVASISAVAATTPDAIALSDTFGNRSYATFLRQAHQLARALSQRGVDQGARVGICLPRSCDLPIAILATLINGAAYVPLDPSYPQRRLGMIVADAAPVIIIVDEKTRAFVPEGWPVQLVNDVDDRAPPFHSAHVDRSDLAYVIHTSGSTGRPSGVEIERGALANFLAGMRLELPLSSNDALLAVTPYSFDISILELLLPLTIGARVVIADESMVRDGGKLAKRLDRGDITLMQATPATWQMLLECGWEGNHRLKALCGGEALQPMLAAKILARAEALWNLYGPTETTIWSTCARIKAPVEVIPLGRPLANTICAVVDEALQPVGMGTVGELLIGGAGLARGYHNDPTRTAERFICAPPSLAGDGKFFRTGDFVRMRSDGTLQFLGRRDQQLKVRGFRVELGEVESVLCDHAMVHEAAVVSTGDDLSDRRLVAFIVTDGSANSASGVFDAYVRDLLPHYMVPSIRLIENIPRLPNGKTDRQRLTAEAAKRPVPKADPSEPTSPIEKRLIALLEELLDDGPIGRDDNFFALGGTSLLAMRYLMRINRVHGLDIGAAEFMRAPTVAAMARLIAASLNNRKEVAAYNTGALPTPHLLGTPWRPLSMLRAEGCFDAIDAAAIAYLPDDLLEAARSFGVEMLVRRRLADADDVHWAAVCRSRLGAIALVVIPRFGHELVAEPAIAVSAVNAALKFAARLGAKSAALTGLIPAATDFGRVLSAPAGLSITTGHATTVAAVALTVMAAAEAAGLKITVQAIAFVGLGSIGTATLRLLMDRGVVPQRLLLCDVPAKARELQNLATEVRSAFGYEGAIEVVEAAGRVPDPVYGCRLIVGATSMPGVLEVERLVAGTVVVDDSFPHCFHTELALERMASRKDVLLVDGGFVKPREPLEWIVALPDKIPSRFEPAFGSYATRLQDPSAITGCILSALLSHSHGATVSLGPVGLETCREHWDVLSRLDIGAAPLRCGSWPIPAANLKSLRKALAAGA